MRRLLLLTVSSCLLLSAPAAAEPTQLSSTLADELNAARSALNSRKASLASARARVPALKRLQRQALLRSPIISRQLEDATRRTRAARERLNRQTLAYIKLVESLGGSGSVAGLDDEQRLLQYLSEVRARDAALVLQQGRALLNRQDAALARLRSSADRLEQAKARSIDLSERQDQLEWQATRAVMENNQRITYLSGRLKLDRANLARLETRMGLLSSANGGVLTGGQVLFSFYLAELSGLDVNLIKAWVLAEMSDGYARDRQSEGNHNWLNIGYFDSLGGGGAFQDLPRVWSDPRSAAHASQAFLQGDFLGASPGIQRIISYAGRSVETQIRAIATSGWASSGYNSGNSLRGTYKLVPKTTQPPRKTVSWKSPRDGKWYRLGKP